MMYVFFTGLMLCLVVAPQPGLPDVALNEIPETDDDRLNQALLLVEILKSEYLKLLRERSGAARKDTNKMEQSSCAVTGMTVAGRATDETLIWTEKQNEMLESRPNALPDATEQLRFSDMMYTTAPPYPWDWPAPGTTVPSRRYHEIMPQPMPPLYHNPFPYQGRFMRRNFPDYSYYYGPYRRNDYYDENHLKMSTESSTSTVPAQPAAVTQPKPVRKSNQLIAGNRRRFNTLLRRSNHQNPRKSGDKEPSHIVAANENNKTTTGSKPHNVSQDITTITRNAMSSTSPNPTYNRTTSITKLVSANNTQKIHPVTKTKVPSTTSTATSADKWPAFLFKSTLRVFLENSTPLPIPLPENNAFCFTNPKSPLCRSP